MKMLVLLLSAMMFACSAESPLAPDVPEVLSGEDVLSALDPSSQFTIESLTWEVEKRNGEAVFSWVLTLHSDQIGGGTLTLKMEYLDRRGNVLYTSDPHFFYTGPGTHDYLGADSLGANLGAKVESLRVRRVDVTYRLPQ